MAASLAKCALFRSFYCGSSDGVMCWWLVGIAARVAATTATAATAVIAGPLPCALKYVAGDSALAQSPVP